MQNIRVHLPSTRSIKASYKHCKPSQKFKLLRAWPHQHVLAREQPSTASSRILQAGYRVHVASHSGRVSRAAPTLPVTESRNFYPTFICPYRRCLSTFWPFAHADSFHLSTPSPTMRLDSRYRSSDVLLPSVAAQVHKLLSLACCRWLRSRPLIVSYELCNSGKDRYNFAPSALLHNCLGYQGVMRGPCAGISLLYFVCVYAWCAIRRIAHERRGFGLLTGDSIFPRLRIFGWDTSFFVMRSTRTPPNTRKNSATQN